MEYRSSNPNTSLATLLLVVLLFCDFSVGINLDLPDEFLPYYFYTYPNVAEECREDPDCPYKVNQEHYIKLLVSFCTNFLFYFLQMHLDKTVCWGYEDNCVGGHIKPYKYSHPICDGDSRGWANSKKEQIESFFTQADFGYIRNFRNSMKMMCQPSSPVCG